MAVVIREEVNRGGANRGVVNKVEAISRVGFITGEGKQRGGYLNIGQQQHFLSLTAQQYPLGAIE